MKASFIYDLNGNLAGIRTAVGRNAILSLLKMTMCFGCRKHINYVSVPGLNGSQLNQSKFKCLSLCDKSRLIQGKSISPRTDCHKVFQIFISKKLKTDLQSSS